MEAWQTDGEDRKSEGLKEDRDRAGTAVSDATKKGNQKRERTGHRDGEQESAPFPFSSQFP